MMKLFNSEGDQKSLCVDKNRKKTFYKQKLKSYSMSFEHIIYLDKYLYSFSSSMWMGNKLKVCDARSKL